jgi:hypothetical protein
MISKKNYVKTPVVSTPRLHVISASKELHVMLYSSVLVFVTIFNASKIRFEFSIRGRRNCQMFDIKPYLKNLLTMFLHFPGNRS